MEHLKVIVTLFLKNEDAFFQALESIGPEQACCIEIRLDSYYPAHSLLETNQMLKKITRLSRLPVLFTMRTEGQKEPCSLQQYGWLINILAKDGYFFDLEMENYEKLKEAGLLPQIDFGRVFLSLHDFKPYDPKRLQNMLSRMKEVDALCLKAAQFCENLEEVFAFIGQVEQIWQKRKTACIAMGEAGLITRLAPWLFGFDYTYCGYESSAAPGQPTLKEIEAYRTLLRD